MPRPPPALSITVYGFCFKLWHHKWWTLTFSATATIPLEQTHDLTNIDQNVLETQPVCSCTLISTGKWDSWQTGHCSGLQAVVGHWWQGRRESVVVSTWREGSGYWLSCISYDVISVEWYILWCHAFEATIPITEFGKGGVAAVYKWVWIGSLSIGWQQPRWQSFMQLVIINSCTDLRRPWPRQSSRSIHLQTFSKAFRAAIDYYRIF